MRADGARAYLCGARACAGLNIDYGLELDRLVSKLPGSFRLNPHDCSMLKQTAVADTGDLFGGGRQQLVLPPITAVRLRLPFVDMLTGPVCGAGSYRGVCTVCAMRFSIFITQLSMEQCFFATAFGVTLLAGLMAVLDAQ